MLALGQGKKNPAFVYSSLTCLGVLVITSSHLFSDLFRPDSLHISPIVISAVFISAFVLVCYSTQLSELLRTPVMSMLGVAIIGITGGALLGYIFKIEVAYTWGTTVSVSYVGIFLLLGLGVGTIAVVWGAYLSLTLRVRELWNAITVYTLGALLTIGILMSYFAALPFYDWMQSHVLETLAETSRNRAFDLEQYFNYVRSHCNTLQVKMDESTTEQNFSREKDQLPSGQPITGYSRISLNGEVILQAGVPVPRIRDIKALPADGSLAVLGLYRIYDSFQFVLAGRRQITPDTTVIDFFAAAPFNIEKVFQRPLGKLKNTEILLLDSNQQMVFRLNSLTQQFNLLPLVQLHDLVVQYLQQRSTKHNVSSPIAASPSPAYTSIEAIDTTPFSIVVTIQAGEIYHQVNESLVEFVAMALVFLSIGSLGVFYLVRQMVVYAENLQLNVTDISKKARTVFDRAPDAILLVNDNGDIDSANEESVALFNQIDSFAGKNISDVLTFPNTEDKIQRQVLPHIRVMAKKTHSTFELAVPNSSGLIPVECVAAEFEQTGHVYYAIFLRDIRDRKAAEQHIQESLQEKEVLLKEIHHRVKNNLQVISSLLRLRGRRLENEDLRSAFKESENRVSSIALLHELLYQSELLSTVKIEPYIIQLCTRLLSSYGVSKKIHIDFDLDDAIIPLDQAMPCGLLITEIVTNAVKHAFPNGHAKPTIKISFKESGPSQYLLIIEDNGRGIKHGKNGDGHADESGSLGTLLIENLTRQINGTLRCSESEGTRYELEFSAIN